MHITVVLSGVLFLVTTALAVPVPERVRFPDERTDDDARAGRILLPPLEQPTREEFLRSRANPIALFIPREPLPLAEPDQSLNAWQFYFPPGPPPAPPSLQVDDDDGLDAEGSAAATVSSPAEADATDDENTTFKDEEITTKSSVEPISSSVSTAKPDTDTPVENNSVQNAKEGKKVLQPTTPPDFQPQFEDGGWAPIARPLSNV